MEKDTKAVKEVKNLLRIYRAERNEMAQMLKSKNINLDSKRKTQVIHFHNASIMAVMRLETLLKEIS